MDVFKERDLVLIRKRTEVGEKEFPAVVTNIEKVYSDPEGTVEWVFGYEPLDHGLGYSGASRVPMRGEFGTVDVKVLASDMLTRAERMQGRRAG